VTPDDVRRRTERLADEPSAEFGVPVVYDARSIRDLADAPVVDLCACDGFRLWYMELHHFYELRVCYCGHRSSEHLDAHGTCTGEIEILR
jgi:hypothetical protein